MCAGVCAGVKDGNSPPEWQLDVDRLSHVLLFYAYFFLHRTYVLTSQSAVSVHLLDCRSALTDGRERGCTTTPQQGVANFFILSYHMYISNTRY